MMTRAEYDLLRGRIEDACRRNLEALDRVWALVRDQAGQAPARPAPARLDVLSEVHAVLPGLARQFTVRDVMRTILGRNPTLASSLKQTSVTASLTRLAERGEILLVRRGSGKRASLFEQAEKAPATPATEEVSAPAGLADLIERARLYESSPQEREAQRVGFAYGNTRIDNGDMVREVVQQASQKVDGKANH